MLNIQLKSEGNLISTEARSAEVNIRTPLDVDVRMPSGVDIRMHSDFSCILCI